MTLLEQAVQQAILTTAHTDFEQALKKHSFFKLQNRALSLDLVQDTFAKTWSYLLKGGKIEAMKAFLYHVLNNLIIDEYRKRKSVSLDVLLEKGFEPSVANSTERLFNSLDGRATFLLIQKLPVTYRKVMQMRYVQELSLKEMSRATGSSTNAITVQAYRGLVKLKALYFKNPLLN